MSPGGTRPQKVVPGPDAPIGCEYCQRWKQEAERFRRLCVNLADRERRLRVFLLRIAWKRSQIRVEQLEALEAEQIRDMVEDQEAPVGRYKEERPPPEVDQVVGRSLDGRWSDDEWCGSDDAEEGRLEFDDYEG